MQASSTGPAIPLFKVFMPDAAHAALKPVLESGRLACGPQVAKFEAESSSQAHKRNDKHSVFASSTCELPGVGAFFDSMIHIPCGWWVNQQQREYIVDVIRRGW